MSGDDRWPVSRRGNNRPRVSRVTDSKFKQAPRSQLYALFRYVISQPCYLVTPFTRARGERGIGRGVGIGMQNISVDISVLMLLRSKLAGSRSVVVVGQDSRRLGIGNIRCITHTWRTRVGVGEGSGGGCEERVEVDEWWWWRWRRWWR